MSMLDYFFVNFDITANSDLQPPSTALETEKSQQSTLTPVIYRLNYKDYPIYCIKRPPTNQLYFLHKNIAQAFYKNPSTFNGICWTNKVEKVNATSMELKMIRDNDPTEHGLKKSTLLSLETLVSLSETIRRPDISAEIVKMADSLDESLLLQPPLHQRKINNLQPSLPPLPPPTITMPSPSPSHSLSSPPPLSPPPPPPPSPSPPPPPPPLPPSPPPLSPPAPVNTTLPHINLSNFQVPPSLDFTTSPLEPPTTASLLSEHKSLPYSSSYTFLPPNLPTPTPSKLKYPPSSPQISTSINHLPTSPGIPPASFQSKTTSQVNSSSDQMQSGKKSKKKYTLSEQYFSATLTDQLQRMEKYWTEPNYLLRIDPVVNQVTFKKRKERILCFMGWCREHLKIASPDLWLFDTNLSSLHRERYETYLGYLVDNRHLGNGTIVEHITAAIFALKFLHEKQAEARFENIKSIALLKNLRNNYQRDYEKGLKSRNWVELREENKFLHYEEIQQTLKALLIDFLDGEEDPSLVYSKAKSVVSKVKQLQRFLVLLFYTALPPSRGLEIRTLQLESSLQFRKTTNTWWLVLSQFKTVKNKGVDSLELEPKSQEVLIKYLELFTNRYRSSLLQHWWAKQRQVNPMITTAHMIDEKYLFIPPGRTKEQCYGESAWSTMISKLFKETTGMSVTINTLRSSFITYFYGSEAAGDPNLKESMAAGMRHSVTEAQKTYDRRTSFERKRKAVDWCGNNTAKWLQTEEVIVIPDSTHLKPGPTVEKQYRDDEPHTHQPNIGDVVAVPFTNGETTFWLGKCLRVEKSTLLLGWLEEVAPSKYKMKIGASWSENINSCVFPVDVQYNEKEYNYTLLTPVDDILSSNCILLFGQE